jgi:hypothetical protein
MMRLDRLHAVDRLVALNTPGNRLEALEEDRKGQYRIRINDTSGESVLVTVQGIQIVSEIRGLVQF